MTSFDCAISVLAYLELCSCNSLHHIYDCLNVALSFASTSAHPWYSRHHKNEKAGESEQLVKARAWSVKTALDFSKFSRSCSTASANVPVSRLSLRFHIMGRLDTDCSYSRDGCVRAKNCCTCVGRNGNHRSSRQSAARATLINLL